MLHMYIIAVGIQYYVDVTHFLLCYLLQTFLLFATKLLLHSKAKVGGLWYCNLVSHGHTLWHNIRSVPKRLAVRD